ncbi:hypothetical protein HL653_07160 [Sphingomonas sp. AP4-R1]|uniref:hypothetical protein n=1 Tax=Sphingomonas sp. AP4-R1 TaxID=2735134 RepID=UPI00149354A0|nr:hypothetical protein [Sphingomonas sp. AP4-R1]QJU57596.1 hypothetical protein HL653_07160 [Sphingomonas sp. AP4-R1]
MSEKKTKKAGKPKGEKAKGANKAGAKAKAHSPEAAIAGIVEDLRDAGAKLAAAANSPAGREVIAMGLSIAATAAQAALASKGKAKGAKPAAAKAEPEAVKAGPAKGSVGEDALAAALGSVAEMALARIFPKKG